MEEMEASLRSFSFTSVYATFARVCACMRMCVHAYAYVCICMDAVHMGLSMFVCVCAWVGVRLQRFRWQSVCDALACQESHTTPTKTKKETENTTPRKNESTKTKI